jgi:RNA polymerase sigma-70 factor (ECF subfamily)
MSSDSLGEAVLGIARSERTRVPFQDQVAELFEELRDDVYRYLLTLGLYPPQAQEAAQEVFLRLYVTLRRNVEVQNPRAWIFRVAHNYGLKVRSQQNSLQPFDPAIEACLEDPETTPETSLLERERTLRFHRAIENLSEQQRRCLLLRLEGLRYPEIGAVLGISASAVGEFMRRAITRLKRVVEP